MCYIVHGTAKVESCSHALVIAVIAALGKHVELYDVLLEKRYRHIDRFACWIRVY